MKDSKIEQLYGNLEIKERRGYGKQTFKYASSNDVIDRMNKVFDGCWHTEVVHQEIIEDSVLVRVRVSVYDEDTDNTFFHEGYGGVLIARFTSGNNVGKPVDIANSFKSAEAKAIKNACSRWGVGLYLEDDTTDSTPTVTAKPMSESPFKGITVGGANVNGPSPFKGVLTGRVDSTVSHTDSPPSSSSYVPHISEEVEAKTVVKNSGNVPNFLSGLIKKPETADTEVLKNKTTNPLEDTEKKSDITNVQMAAIENITNIKDIGYAELVKNALGIETAPDKEDLTYEDAIKVINYGSMLIKDDFK